MGLESIFRRWTLSSLTFTTRVDFSFRRGRPSIKVEAKTADEGQL